MNAGVNGGRGISIAVAIHFFDPTLQEELPYTVARVNLDFGGARRQLLQTRGERLVDFTLD